MWKGQFSAATLLAVAVIVLFVYGLDRGELYRNETLRAQLAGEMLRSGKWIVPSLYGEPLLTKPPLQYWLVTLFSLPFGEVTEVTARLPSVLGATALVIALFCHIRSRLNTTEAVLTCLLIPVSWLWLEKVPSAELDMLLTAWVGLALVAGWHALDAEERQELPRAWSWWLVALLAVAFGVLTKWIAWLYFYAAMLPLAVWRGQWRSLIGPRHLLAAFIGFLVVAAWGTALCLEIGWQSAAEQILAEARAKFVTSHHSGPPRWLETLFHPGKIFLATLPWSIWLGFTLLRGWWSAFSTGQRRLAEELSCWFWPNLLLFTLLPEHGTRHNFPFMPATGALAGLTWTLAYGGRLPEKLLTWHRRFVLSCVLTAGGLVIIGTSVGLWVTSFVNWWLIIGLSVVAIVTLRDGYTQARLGNKFRVALCLFVTWVLAKIAYVELVVPQRDAERQVRRKAAFLASLLPPNTVPVLSQLKDEGLMFYLKRPVLRQRNWNQIAVGGNGIHCLLLTAAEWRKLQDRSDWHLLSVHTVLDSQNDPVFVVLITLKAPSRFAEHASSIQVR